MLLVQIWVKPFGFMEVLVVDQGPEFAGEEFADYFREQGVLVHFTDGQTPWQNGPTERAGGAFKEMLDKVILDATIVTNEEYLEAADLLNAQRNVRGGPQRFFARPATPRQEREIAWAYSGRRSRRRRRLRSSGLGRHTSDLGHPGRRFACLRVT